MNHGQALVPPPTGPPPTPHPLPRRSLFPQPWPRKVLLAWGTAGALFAAFFGAWCWRYYVQGRRGPAGAANGRSSRRKAQ